MGVFECLEIHKALDYVALVLASSYTEIVI